MLLLKRTALVALSQRCLVTRIRLSLMLYFFMLSTKAFLKSKVYEDMVDVLLVLEIYFTNDSQVKDLVCEAPSVL